jgi:asparagine synthase (glutamine-hydrolysing)
MPGIAGIVSRQPSDECQRQVERMVASMRHEKFYTAGTYAAPELGVFAGWVALENSFSDCQPVRNEAGDVALVIAGECFSDQRARGDLRARGHRFDDNRAAWLVHDYEERGEAFFEALNGTFSGLLIDRRCGHAYLFNDRYGMERIYWRHTDDGLFFASEAKALLTLFPDARNFDEAGLVQFLRYGCTLGSQTLFRHVSLLPPASRWRLEGTGRCEQTRYFTPSNWDREQSLGLDAFTDALDETFARVLPRYVESESKLGISLTAGLDTRMIMACLPPTAEGAVTYTFAGRDSETLDARLAARVAAAAALPHYVVRIRDDFFTGFDSLLDRTVYVTDGSLGACGAHEVYLNSQARELASIRLTGNFGSEILRGATMLKPLGLSPHLLAPGLRDAVAHADTELGQHAGCPAHRAAFRDVPSQLGGIVRAAHSQVITRTPYLDNEIVALAFRASDAVTRSSAPALDVVVRNRPRLAAIPTDRGVSARRLAASLPRRLAYTATFKLEYWCGDGMPNWLARLDATLARRGAVIPPLGLHKYLHYARWFRTRLADTVRDRVAASGSALWEPSALARLAEDHVAGRSNNLREINAVLTLASVARSMFSPSARAPLA